MSYDREIEAVETLRAHLRTLTEVREDRTAPAAPAQRRLMTIDSIPVDPLDFTVETDMIDVTTGVGAWRSDEEWAYVDAHGHFHSWSGERLPTLRKIEDDYQCIICEAPVTPGLLYVPPPPGSETIPGQTQWRGTALTPFDFEWLRHTRDVSVTYTDGDVTRFGVAFVRALTERSDDRIEVRFSGYGELGTRAGEAIA